MNQKNSGFTIVELLIVIVVIAILAVIVVVAYNGIQARAGDAKKQADIRNIAQQLEIYYQDNGHYPQYYISEGEGFSFADWRNVHMPNLKDGVLTPPGASFVSLVNSITPTESQYGYHTNGSCVSGRCAVYRLYWKSSVDGQVKSHIGSTG